MTPIDDLIFPLDMEIEDDELEPTQEQEINWGYDDTPVWFKNFYRQYQRNEDEKYLLLQKMHLEMIDYEIRKCELLRDIINKLK